MAGEPGAQADDHVHSPRLQLCHVLWILIDSVRPIHGEAASIGAGLSRRLPLESKAESRFDNPLTIAKLVEKPLTLGRLPVADVEVNPESVTSKPGSIPDIVLDPVQGSPGPPGGAVDNPPFDARPAM